jgi:hypothetical protein
MKNRIAFLSAQTAFLSALNSLQKRGVEIDMKTRLALSRACYSLKKKENRIAYYEIDEEEGTSKAQREENYARWLNADPWKISLAEAEQLTDLFWRHDPLFGTFPEMDGRKRRGNDWRIGFQKLQENNRQMILARDQDEKFLSLLRICPNCNRAFLIKKSLKQEFCDHACRLAYRNATRKGTPYYSTYRANRRRRSRALARKF